MKQCRNGNSDWPSNGQSSIREMAMRSYNCYSVIHKRRPPALPCLACSAMYPGCRCNLCARVEHGSSTWDEGHAPSPPIRPSHSCVNYVFFFTLRTCGAPAVDVLASVQARQFSRAMGSAASELSEVSAVAPAEDTAGLNATPANDHCRLVRFAFAVGNMWSLRQTGTDDRKRVPECQINTVPPGGDRPGHA